MSYTPPPSGYLVPAAPGSSPRPSTVSVSALLLYVISAVLVLSSAISVYTFASMPEGLIEDIYREAGMDANLAETSAAAAAIGSYAGAAVYVLLAVLFVVLGLFVGRGKQWARITTWVLAGIGLCCVGFGLAFQSVGSSFGTSNTGGIDQAEVTERLADAMPAWSTTVSTLLSVVLLLSMLAVIIMLALPPSNAYFRKPAPEWTPPAYPTV
ncbi:hypothetical protein [Catellatospora paridis]|uniref:hypothetical protein n=1 Tax=Catellatospora paridis TaxID=1617086 RepID=UPI0012D4506E|nr:hypothetical protein [Catellatospora paridis]